MKHVPRQPRDGVNVSTTHPLAEAGTLIAGLAALFVVFVLLTVFLVEVVLYFVPAEKEADLFSSWLPDDLETVSPDDERLVATQALVDGLALLWPESPYEFRVEIDNSDVANALAFPGGLIVVTRGLLDDAETENELAFVLGHELGHYHNRDHIRALGRGAVLALFFAVTTRSDVSGLGLNVGDLTLRSFGRKQELAADEFGLALVNQHYGHVRDAWRMFERWQEESGSPSNAGAIAAYTSTHPQTADRIRRLEQLAMREGWLLDGPVTALAW
ncbi:MAG: M48 family metallopeptidase [Woeseiaceae bacterium]